MSHVAPTPADMPAASAAGSAADEWATLVAAAVVGTDRHPVPAPAPGWDVWGTNPDPAIALLDRSVAVVAARRAGALADPPSVPPPAAPVDTRQPCPAACTARLQRLLRGEHDLLLPEWLDHCRALELRPPWVLLPALLLRGRRQPELDALVRDLAGARAAWLAAEVPELGIRPVPSRLPSGSVATVRRPPRADDSGAVVAAIVQTFADRAATWAVAPQLRLLVASIDPLWLPALVGGLSQLQFDVASERTRADLLGFAEFRMAMLAEFGDGVMGAAVPAPRV